MKLLIQKEVREAFGPILGILYASGIDNTKEITEIKDLFAEAVEKLKADFAGYENVGQHPYMSCWRGVYKKFGTDAQKYRSSIESLARRVLKGDPLPRINTLVDLYNYISIKYVLPLGGEDMDKIEGDLHLAFANGTEQFVRLNGVENEPPDKGEVVYKDDLGVICRRWNWREADRTKLTKETRNAVIVVDAVPPVTADIVEQATKELASLVEKYCGGKVIIEILV